MKKSMEIDKILNLLFYNYESFHCLDIFKKLYLNDVNFKNRVIYGIKYNKLRGIPYDILVKLDKDYIDNRHTETVFESLNVGRNIGKSTMFSEFFCSLYSASGFCRGKNLFFPSYTQSKDGLITWIITDRVMIDPTLMLEIDLDYIEEMNYVLFGQTILTDNYKMNYYI